MKKYLVLSNDDFLEIELEIELEKLTETDIFNKIQSKFGLVGNYAMTLMFIKVMDIYSFTITKRGTATTFLIKEIKDSVPPLSNNNLSNLDKFDNLLEELLNGEIDTINLEKISKSDLEDKLKQKGFDILDSYIENECITYYYSHDEWKLDDDNDYFNRLNVEYNLSDLSLTIFLEEIPEVLENLKDIKYSINKKRNELDSLEEEINNLSDKKNCLESEIEDMISTFRSENNNYYY